MTDELSAPAVKALHYRVDHDDSVDYARASPVVHAEADFRIRIADGKASVELIAAFCSVEQARSAVEPFLKLWEVTAKLERGPGELEFIFQKVEMVDRDPGNVTVSIPVQATMTVSSKVSRASYPPAPKRMRYDQVVAEMAKKFSMYQEGRTTLPDAANYCLTALEYSIRVTSVKKRPATACYYGIDLEVLKKIGELTATKGGPEARKHGGSKNSFSPAERHWLDTTLRQLIRRAAEKSHDAAAHLPQITMGDLPPLPSVGLP